MNKMIVGIGLIVAFIAGFFARYVSPWHGAQYFSSVSITDYDYSLSESEIGLLNSAVADSLKRWKYIECLVIPEGAGRYSLRFFNDAGMGAVPKPAMEEAHKTAQETIFKFEANKAKQGDSLSNEATNGKK